MKTDHLMASLFGTLFELALLVVVLFAQRSIARRLLTWASSRWPARAVRLLLSLLITAGVLILFGVLLSIPRVGGEAPLPRGVSGWWRAISLLWAFSSTAAYLVYLLLRQFWKTAPTPAFNPSRRNLINAVGGALIGTPFAVTGFGALVGRTDFRVREVDVPIGKLPPDLDGLRLVQLSDIHLSPFLSEMEFSRVVDAANELRAEVALFTGDLISAHGDPLDACLRQLSRLRAEAGILGCLGNHEIYADAEDYATRQGGRLGIRFLRGQAEPLRFGDAVLNFAGVDYQRMSWRPRYLQGAERMILPGAVNVLLSHNPDVFPAAAAKGFQLTLSGHTHGGQITVEILHQSLNMARFYTPFVYGLYCARSGAAAYVSRGIGTIAIPVRVGAPPEISLLRLRKA